MILSTCLYLTIKPGQACAFDESAICCVLTRSSNPTYCSWLWSINRATQRVASTWRRIRCRRTACSDTTSSSKTTTRRCGCRKDSSNNSVNGGVADRRMSTRVSTRCLGRPRTSSSRMLDQCSRKNRKSQFKSRSNDESCDCLIDFRFHDFMKKFF